MSTRQEQVHLRKAWALIVLLSFSTPAFAEANLATGSLKEKTADSRAHSQSVKELSTQIMNAYGGYEKMKALDAMSFKSIGDLKQYSTISGAVNTFETETFSKGVMLRSKIELMGQPMITGYDGKQCWIQQGEHVFPADETTTQRIVEEIKHGMVLLLKLGEPDTRIELAGKKSVDGHECTGIKIFTDDGKATTFYADNASHLILSSEYEGTDLEQGLSTLKLCQYGDNRPILSSVMPYKITEYSGDKKSAETQIKSIEKVEIEDSMFAIPTETQIARLKQGPVTIPFEYMANEIVIHVTLNNKQSLRFLVDTGATQSILDQDVASSIGKYKQSNISMTTGAGSVAMNYMNLETVSLGDINLQNVPFAVTSLSSFDQLVGKRPAGLIGANILKRFLVTFDYEKRQMILQDPSFEPDLTNAQVVKTKPALGVSGLAVEGLIDGKVAVNCLVDTGAAFNNISEPVVRSILPSTLMPMGDVLGLDGKRIRTSSVRFKSIAIGPISVDNPVFSVATQNAAVPAGIFSGGTRLAVLGNPFWSRYRMTVDYRGQRLILETTPERKKANLLQAKIEQVQSQQLLRPDSARSIKNFLSIAEDAREANSPSVEALAKANAATLEMDVAVAKGNSEGQEIALKRFDDAIKLAEGAHDNKAQAQVTSLLSIAKLKNAKTQDDFVNSRMTLGKAAKLAPSEPLVMVAAGLILVQLKNNDLAEKVLNQALTLEPTNWSGLWAKYKLANSLGQTATAKLVAEQLRHYYPQAAEVKALHLQSDSAKSTANETKKTTTTKKEPAKK
ncbi:MAG: aspartyl protease family protein [Leptolyngbya sp.]|nr:aspartyl protease family protein [Candidatus Melainabacteria bacterium]